MPAKKSNSTRIIQCQLKLILRPPQERMLRRWLWHLTGVYNWTLRKIELDAADGRYHSQFDMMAMVNGHSKKMGIPSKVLRGTVDTARNAWVRCFSGHAKRPHRKGRRNRLSSVALGVPLPRPRATRIAVPGVGKVKFHGQDIPLGAIKCGRIVFRSSGWYLCLFIQAPPRTIERVGAGEVGIDPGFSHLLTLSTGEKIEHPRELQRTSQRLGQAQRGCNQRLVARLKEREANQRKDRNHKHSRRLVAGNTLIAWSSDNHRAMARIFGKSVASAAHGQLRQMLAYKSRAGGTTFVEVPSRRSTMTCSACGSLSGPTGYAGLSVRQWRCGCGAEHDRDVNAAVNTLLAGRGMRLERVGHGTSETAIESNTAEFSSSAPQEPTS